MLSSTAVVLTESPDRYAKQLLAHLGRKVAVESLPDLPAPAGRLVFEFGTGTVLPQGDRLVLEAVADSAESLARLQDVLGRHLERFGARNELVVTFSAPEAPPAGFDPPDAD